MKTKIKWILTAGLLVLLLVFALLVPYAADCWYDRKTLGQQAYVEMEYEPYEISYYGSFEDKLDAITACIEAGAVPYAVTLEEGEDAPDDETLAEAANEELQALYQNGILSGKVEVEAFQDRLFYEMYVVPQKDAAVSLQDVCFWTLTAKTHDGWIAIALDSEFHKIYWITVQSDVQGAQQEVYDGMKLAEGWCHYWELEDPIIDHEDDGTKTNTQSVDGSAGEEGGVYTILSKQRYRLEISYSLSDFSQYGKNGGWYLTTGILSIMYL